MLLAFFALTCTSAEAHTIVVIPANPDSSTQIELQIGGFTGSSVPIYFYTFAIVGHTVRVEGCIPPGFETPSAYQFTVNIGALNPGTYTVEYYTLFCGPPGQPGNPTGPLFLETTLNLTVLSAVAAAAVIPTLQSGSIGALGVLIALVSVLIHRRRAHR
jgi:hypothetical protein